MGFRSMSLWNTHLPRHQSRSTTLVLPVTTRPPQRHSDSPRGSTPICSEALGTPDHGNVRRLTFYWEEFP